MGFGYDEHPTSALTGQVAARPLDRQRILGRFLATFTALWRLSLCVMANPDRQPGIARRVLPGPAFKDFTLNAMQTQPIAQLGQA